MLKQYSLLLAFLCCGLPGAPTETIQLKEKAAVVGKILSEKKDQIIVDLGFTVLAVPRSQIVKISNSDAAEPAPKVVASKAAKEPIAKAPVEKAGFYSAPNKP